MMKFITLLILATLLFASRTFAQKPKDVCYVNTHWWSRAEGIGSGNYLLGQLRPARFDEQTTKTFSHQDSSLIVNVGVEYVHISAASEGKPIEIRVVLSVSDEENKAVELADAVTAGTSYGKRWGNLYVEKKVIVGQFIHTFSVTCNDGSKLKKR